MLMEVRNQLKVIFLSFKYNIMKQMLNKITFFTNIIFMILNNATYIIQWIILFNLRDEIGGYTIKEVVLLWGLAAEIFGIAHIFFNKAFELSDLIINGKLDTFLVQPKNVYLNVICSDTSISAIGDFIYGFICLFIYGLTIKNLLLFILFSFTGAIILTSFSSIVGSLSFWIIKGDILADSLNNIMINFATYPGTIFKNFIKIILYTVIPVGISNYIPVSIILEFSFCKFMYVIIFTVLIVILAFIIFNKGIKRYSSSNLMISRI